MSKLFRPVFVIAALAATTGCAGSQRSATVELPKPGTYVVTRTADGDVVAREAQACAHHAHADYRYSHRAARRDYTKRRHMRRHYRGQ